MMKRRLTDEEINEFNRRKAADNDVIVFFLVETGLISLALAMICSNVAFEWIFGIAGIIFSGAGIIRSFLLNFKSFRIYTLKGVRIAFMIEGVVSLGIALLYGSSDAGILWPVILLGAHILIGTFTIYSALKKG